MEAGGKDRNTQFWVGRGGAAGDTEEGTLENTFLNWLLFYNFLTMAICNFKGFLILRKFTSQVRQAGTLIIQAEERLGKARFDLDRGCCYALSFERQPPFPPSPALGRICLLTAEGPRHKVPAHPAAQGLCLWLPPPC